MIVHAAKRKKWMVRMIIPLVLIFSLLVVGTVFADDEIIPDTAAADTDDGSGASQGEEVSVDGGADASDEEDDSLQEASSAEETTDEAFTEEENGSLDEGTASDDSAEESLDENAEESSDENTDESEDEAVEESDDQTAEESSEDEESSTDSPADDETQDEDSGTAEDEIVSEGDEADDLGDTAADLAEEDITVVDENGEEVDMASEDSAETLSSSDPYWYVNGVKYAYVKTGSTCPSDASYCYESDTPIQSALDYISSNDASPDDGILYILADSYTEDVTIDGTSGNGNLSSLQGIVSTGSSSDTTITGTVTISNTTEGFTLIGMTIVGQLEISGNVGTITLQDVTVESSSGNGITITDQDGDVEIEQVESNSNTAYGLYVDNTESSKLSVTVTNSEFSHNSGSGLYINTNGIVTLDGVTASGNTANGAELSAVKGTSVTASSFLNNTGAGLVISNESTKNAVSLEEVLAEDNGNEGITITTGGNISLKNLTVYNNGDTGSSNGVTITHTGTGTVSVVSSSFTSNNQTGLYIISMGTININGITANENGSGVYIDNSSNTKSVTISSNVLNTFSDNTEDGLYILSAGKVILSYFEADGNGAQGIYINNAQNNSKQYVKIALSYTPDDDFLNSISENGEGGLWIISNGQISIVNLNAENNGSDVSGTSTDLEAQDTGEYTGSDFSILLDNSGAAKNQKVTLKNVYANNSGISGLGILSKGAVSLTNISASGNAGDGLYVDTTAGKGKLTTSTSRSVSTNEFTDNGGFGLYILISDVVNLKNITATGNGYGAYINSTSADNKNVYITSADFSNSTIGTGLEIVSSGAIVLKKVDSSSNLLSGVVLNNTTSSKAANVKVYDITANSNAGGSGLEIDSLGIIIMEDITATGNAGDGVTLDNARYDSETGLCAGSKSARITGDSNDFSSNTGSGVYILSNGLVKVYNVTADSNGSYGLYVYNAYSGSKGDVKLSVTGGYSNSFSSNGAYGVYVESLGYVMTANLEANENTSGGVLITNSGSLNSDKVDVGKVVASGNTGNGLYIDAAGRVTLKSVETQTNLGYGIYINNTYNNGTQDVLITSVSKSSLGIDSSNNTNEGLYVITKGNINIKDATVSGNGGDGAYLNNKDSEGKSVTLQNASFDDNTGSGVEILTTGKIDWKGGGASGNLGGDGASVVNNTSISYSPVTISNAEFDENAGIGLSVYSLGSISLSLVSANDNEGTYGAYLINYVFDSGTETYTGISDIMVKGVRDEDDFSGNTGYGLSVNTLGDITVINVDASSNGNDGMVLNNAIEGYAGSITVKATSKQYYAEVSNNGGNGMTVNSLGEIELANLNATGNSGYGIYAANDTAISDQSVSLLRVKSGENGSDGMYVLTKGAISVKYAEDFGNTGNGIKLDNTASTSGQGVSVTRVEANGDGNDYGLAVYTTGDVVLTTVSTSGYNIGTYIDTDGAVTVLDKYGDNVFSNNASDGLLIEAAGDVTLTGVIAEWNGADGLDITTGGDLEINDAYLRRNGSDGLGATAVNAELNNLRSYNNTGDGVNLMITTVAEINRSVINGNSGDGIQINDDATLKLYKATYFGNDVDNTGDENIHYVS